MEESRAALSDTELRDRILAGLAAVSELQVRFRLPLERYLVGKCSPKDGRSVAKAVEFANIILEECFTKNPSLLEQWKGTDNLAAFLQTSAHNRLRTWWKSPDYKKTEVDTESIALKHASGTVISGDAAEAVLAENALRAGVKAAVDECPEGVVFMRLKGLHGVDQRKISRCWGHNEAQTSRWVGKAMDIIRTKAGESAAGSGCEVSMEVLQRGLQRDPSILLGNGESAPGGDGDDSLRKLAAGKLAGKSKTEVAARNQLVKRMCGDSRMLAFFARMLNRRDELEALVVTDPALSGMAARLAECLRRSLEILHPSEAAGLVTPLMSASFADVLRQVGADGGTLWLPCPGEAVLEAVFNPLEPEIAGKRQPLVSGIVSLVLATDEPACVSSVTGHHRHSPAIDMSLGKTTHGMIAVPFVLGGTLRGVLTAVHLVPGKAFGPVETGIVGRWAEILAGLLVERLTARILG